MRVVFILFFMVHLLFSAKISQSRWNKGEAFSVYLEKNGIPVTLLKSISEEDQQYLSEIQAGEWFYELREDGSLLQALIPVGEEMQIHLSRDMGGEGYHFDITPIICRNLSDTVSFKVEKGLYEDINRWTKNPRLGYLLKRYYGKTVNFRQLRRGDKIAFVYTQKSRLGKPYASPRIWASLIKTKGREKFIFADKGGVFYDDIYKDISYKVQKKIKKAEAFVKPVRRMRITSKFTYKRWHPILKRYRPHLGVDIGAGRGTRIHATHKGKVIYAGWMGGYGKVIKITHPGGFVSLYAHQSRLAVKKGQYVKRGQVIGYVGNTGRSTAPHLHFGLYKNAKAVNPIQYINKRSIGKKRIEIKKITEHKIVAIPGAKTYKKRILRLIEKEASAFKWETYVKPYNTIRERSRYEEYNQTL